MQASDRNDEILSTKVDREISTMHRAHEVHTGPDTEVLRVLGFSSEGGGGPKFTKVGVDKTATPLFWQQKFYDPPQSPIHLTP